VREDNPVYILGSYALLAYFNNEQGVEQVKQILLNAQQESAKAYLSMINLGEVLYIVERERGLSAAQRTLSAIDQLPITLLEASRDQILTAAHIKASYSLAYADAFVIASAQDLSGHIVTGAPEFKSVEGIVEIDWLGVD